VVVVVVGVVVVVVVPGSVVVVVVVVVVVDVVVVEVDVVVGELAVAGLETTRTLDRNPQAATATTEARASLLRRVAFTSLIYWLALSA
jgi:hypothetical protein